MGAGFFFVIDQPDQGGTDYQAAREFSKGNSLNLVSFDDLDFPAVGFGGKDQVATRSHQVTGDGLAFDSGDGNFFPEILLVKFGFTNDIVLVILLQKPDVRLSQAEETDGGRIDFGRDVGETDVTGTAWNVDGACLFDQGQVLVVDGQFGPFVFGPGVIFPGIAGHGKFGKAQDKAGKQESQEEIRPTTSFHAFIPFQFVVDLSNLDAICFGIVPEKL